MELAERRGQNKQDEEMSSRGSPEVLTRTRRGSFSSCVVLSGSQLYVHELDTGVLFLVQVAAARTAGKILGHAVNVFMKTEAAAPLALLSWIQVHGAAATLADYPEDAGNSNPDNQINPQSETEVNRYHSPNILHQQRGFCLYPRNILN